MQIDRKKTNGGYPSTTISRILTLVRDDEPSINPHDIAILIGGDWGHPDRGYGFIDPKQCDQESVVKQLNERSIAMAFHVAKLHEAVSSGASFDEIHSLSASTPYQIVFVSIATEDGVLAQLREMESRGFGYNEFDVQHYVKRGEGDVGYGVFFHEVYSYWLGN